MPSVWTFVGTDARTALTAFVFQVTAASGGTKLGLRLCAEAPDSATVAPTAAMPATTSNSFS